MHEQILEQLKRFSAGELSDQQLEEWVLAHLQQILDSHDDQAIQIGNELDALFIQAGENLLSPDMLVDALHSLYLRETSTVWVDHASHAIESFSVPTVRKQWGEPHVVTGLTGVLA